MADATYSLPRRLSAWRVPALSPAAAYAVRFGVAVSAAIWIGNAPGLAENHPTWILITVLMLMQPTTGASVMKALLRGVGTVAAAFTAILLFGLFAQEPPLLMAGLFLTQAIGAYGNSGPRFQYAWFVFAFTTAIVLGDAMAGQGAVETIAFQRASMVGIGILLCFVIDSLLWPARAEPRLRESLASRARFLGDALSRAIATPEASRSDDPGAPAPGPASLANQLALVDAARKELAVSRTELNALARLPMLLETLASRARVLETPIEMPGGSGAEGQPLAAALTELAQRVEAALEEVAAALTASRSPSAFADDLERALLELEAARDRLARSIGWNAELEGRSADLRDLVSVLCTIEATLSPLEGSEAADPSGSRPHFRPDPFRVKIALRAGFAVIAAFLVPLTLGWPMNPMVAPVAFMVASLARGAALQTLTSLAAVLAIGWAVADLVSVYVTPHLERAPLALLVPFALAGAFALIAAKRPKLAMLPSIGGLVAFLSVYGGTSAPTDVYGPYSTLCYVGLALAIGWLFGRLMWPATAAGLFRQRLAAQLALCQEAVREAGESGDAGRGRRAARLVQGCAEHSAQLGPLHQQALLEPVERGLDPSRRARILALVMDLMDVVLGHRHGALEPWLERGGEPLRPLLDALRRADEALLASGQAAVAVLRGDAAHRVSDLAEAHQAVEDRVNELRADPGAFPELTDQEKRPMLVEFDSRRKLVFRQRAIEDWLEDWRAEEEGHDPERH